EHQKTSCVAGRDRSYRQEVQGDEECRNRQNRPTRRWQFPTMFGVKSDTKENRSDGSKDQKLQNRNLRNLGPQTDNQRGGATDYYKTADNLTPTDVALLHERVEHFGKGASWPAQRWS